MLRSALGDQLLIPFAQLFVWTDRLTAIAHLLHLDSQHVPDKSIATGRNTTTLVAYAIGILYEASNAILALRNAGVKRLVPQSTHWVGLDGLRKRWRDSLPLKTLRNEIAFHADAGKICDGLERVIRKRRPLILLKGDSSKKMYCQHSLGPNLLVAGLRYTRKHLRHVVQQIRDDHASLGDLAWHVFMDVLHAKGLMKSV